MVWENEVETTNGENRRWTRTNISIVKRDNKFYSVHWEEGLTESQENEYYDQEAPEVKQIEDVVIIKKWVEV